MFSGKQFFRGLISAVWGVVREQGCAAASVAAVVWIDRARPLGRRPEPPGSSWRPPAAAAAVASP